jgi:hypothetical protein
MPNDEASEVPAREFRNLFVKKFAMGSPIKGSTAIVSA